MSNANTNLTTVNHPNEALFHLLKMEDADMGWEKSCLIGEAAMMINLEPNPSLHWVKECLETLMSDGSVVTVKNRPNLVKLSKLQWSICG
jgi:hypothetical protein